MFAAVLGLAFVLSGLGGGGEEARQVTIGVEGDGAAFAAVLQVGNESIDPTVTEPADGVAELTDGVIDVLFDGRRLTWSGRPDFQIDEFVRTAVQQQAFASRAGRLGLEDGDVADLFEPVEIEEVRLDGGSEENSLRFATAAAAGFANFMLIQIWGAFVMMGVTEEKSSKVIEVLLSQVRASTLLGGKLLGLGMLAVGQMCIVLVGLVIGLSLVDDLDVPSDVWGTVPLLAVTFLLGFAFYATAFAAVGSMISRQEDAQTAQMPVMLPLLVGYLIGTASFASPGNLAVTIGSFVPFTSPVLLPFRVALVEVPLWQVALSLTILAASTVIMLQVAGRIYRYSLLRTGARVTWREAWLNRGQNDLV
jgi:ABC-2 type transport system permease protein